MWQGQQPGGEQHPNQQGPNPYQQPPQYGQQQPYGQQPNPYQQPAPGWSPPTPPGGMQPPQKQGPKTSSIVAIVTAVAVLAAAVVVGVVLMNRDDGGKDPVAGTSKSPKATKKTDEPSQSTSDDPRSDGANGGLKAVVPGWKPVSNPKHGTLFDVPPSWEVLGADTGWGLEDPYDKSDFPGPAVSFSAPAVFKQKWCKSGDDTYTRASVGTKGAQGAKNTGEAATNEAMAWAAYGYYKDPKKEVKAGKLEYTKPKAFSNSYGTSGKYVIATTTGATKTNKCTGQNGKAVAFSFEDKEGELKTFVLLTDFKVKDEVPQSTIEKMMKSLRPLEQ
ncbi:hypothetical protein G5C51_03520 [Streptomyces sp. A7024]|uniref:DUF8017 domain-containing protein n=1 Tax=Streptomyces coryli TaxID=1128680 RepID=A0A6G4TT41_9ACTN|nr:hypothetical protein [Streptomyces coryli]NGN62973.1 hypothetical protein [Streptomyces coryli]